MTYHRISVLAGMVGDSVRYFITITSTLLRGAQIFAYGYRRFMKAPLESILLVRECSNLFPLNELTQTHRLGYKAGSTRYPSLVAMDWW
jgi:hypothetical protein